MARLISAPAAAGLALLLLVTASPAAADVATGCLTRAGKITKLGLGNESVRPCGGRETEITLQVGDGNVGVGQVIKVFERFPFDGTLPGDYEILRIGGYVIIARFEDYRPGTDTHARGVDIRITHETARFGRGGADMTNTAPGVYTGLGPGMSAYFNDLDNEFVKHWRNNFYIEHFITVNGEALYTPFIYMAFINRQFVLALEVEHIQDLEVYFLAEWVPANLDERRSSKPLRAIGPGAISAAGST